MVNGIVTEALGVYSPPEAATEVDRMVLVGLLAEEISGILFNMDIVVWKGSVPMLHCSMLRSCLQA